MFPKLKKPGKVITGRKAIAAVFNDPAFGEFGNINVLPLIYDEAKKQCNIMVFEFDRARENTRTIQYEETGSGRKHPVFRFYDGADGYICEVRYGDASLLLSR